MASTHASVKKKAGALDLGILVSTTDKPASAAACLTRNVFKAAPVTVTTELLQSGGGRARGFIVNSGCANAVTGKKGLEDAWEMSNTVTSQLPPGQPGIGTLVMSTGVIGQHLPISSIVSKIPELVRSLDDSPKSWLDLSKAFMTTDTFPKLRAKSFKLGERLVRIAGIDKGAGMIAPSMGPPQPPHATLLGVIATDAAISPSALQSALNYAVDRSFNNITVDGDMSTNDSIICLANGAAGKLDAQGRETAEAMEEITEDGNPEEYKVFREELRSFAEELAQLVVRDGEGATKFVTIRVKVSCLKSIWERRLSNRCLIRTLLRTRLPKLSPRASRIHLCSRRLCMEKVRLSYDQNSANVIQYNRCQLGSYSLCCVSALQTGPLLIMDAAVILLLRKQSFLTGSLSLLFPLLIFPTPRPFACLTMVSLKPI